MGLLCQHQEALKEAVERGVVECLVGLVAGGAAGVRAAGAAGEEARKTMLKQGGHAAFALRVVLEGGGREAVRRCEAVGGMDVLLDLSRIAKQKQVVENAVVAISMLTSSARAVSLDCGFESTAAGVEWSHRPQSVGEDTRASGLVSLNTYVSLMLWRMCLSPGGPVTSALARASGLVLLKQSCLRVHMHVHVYVFMHACMYVCSYMCTC